MAASPSSSSSSSSSSCFCVFVCMISISAFTLPILSTADSPSSPTPSIPSSYTPHCSSIVPTSSPTHPITRLDLDSLLYLFTPYFTGGHQLLSRKNQAYINGRKSLRLELLPNCHETVSPGVFLIQAILHFRSPYIADFNHVRNNFTYGGTYSGRRQSQGSVRFSFTGFWSETSMKACMVGSTDLNFGDGRTLNISGVVKLKYVSQKSYVNIHTSVISGSLASMSSKTDPEYFDPISMFNFPPLQHYNYSLLSEEISNFSNLGVAKSQSLGLGATMFCSDLFWRSTFLEMDYTGNCTEPEDCSPLGNSVLPRYLYLMPIQCSEDEKKIRYLARFMNGSNLMGEDFSIESTIIAEGVWDDETNQMLVGACRMLNPIDHFADPLAKCGIRLSFRYPSVLTIRNDSMVVGELWSKGSGKDERYFRKIELRRDDMDNVAAIMGQKHEYTEMTRVVKSCPVENTVGEGKTYPDGKSSDMKFDALVQNSEGEHLASAYATPVFVGEELYQSSVFALNNMNEEAKNDSKLSDLKVSYKISIHPFLLDFNSSERIWKLNASFSPRHQVEISAEGVYNVETGHLCMVGCRRLWKMTENLKDCEILVKFEFPPLDNRKGSRINGTIVSTRRGEDPLHFESLTLSAVVFYTEMAEKSIWRMDLEIALVLISSTLFCIFVAFQIFHVKRHPEVISSISLMMVMILALGNMIPLVLNIEAVFSETHNKQTMFGWLEANEVAVRVITMVAFLLQIRLVQLVWTAKLHEGLDKGVWSPWSSEKKASLVTLLLHILGALFTLLFHWTTESYDEGVQGRYGRQVHSVWGDLRSYAGLILDGFLLPQIILNAVGGSTEKALSNLFYIGTSAIRIAPHAYNQYRLQNYAGSNGNGTYYYADHADELYSSAWDVLVPLGVVTMALVVFLQQSCL